MINANNDRTKFVEALSWMGAPPYPMLFYAVCDQATEGIVEIVRPLWPADSEIDFFRLAEDWPFEIALVEINAPVLPDDLDRRVRMTLETVAHKASTATCFMFEGGFGDYRQLFDPEQQRSTYGVCLESSPAIVCTRDNERESLELANELKRAKGWLLKKYLGDKNIVSS